eukprot:CAMPEP_0175133358 /NCGR_PEP_ID=MMETSP0087-20121206/7597_1 /TAXON_ID=136419 /ORGANISM="Unknown Unknown, Strain D1" /LENGTH=409 /DNA_ID=CAMNT_0016415837 /DNA_START=32 /DNA_END=1261 /DNA_ORIENTATION=-
MFTPIKVGELSLKHRVVLAPLTRTRASEPELAPRDMAVEYYAQRATPGGLLITEATNISPEAVGYPHTPGIWTAAQTAAWKKVTDAVHAKGAYIVMQLWHVGRVSHPDFAQHPLAASSGLALPSVSASDIPIKGNTRTYLQKKTPHVPARPLATEEIARLVGDYRHAAENAKRAGFDGVELHAAHGYLIDQFLNSGVNTRNDEYGGSMANRCRLLLEVVEALVGEYGSGRVGVRLSPHSEGTMKYAGCTDADPESLYFHAVSCLNRFNLMYLLLSEPRWFGTKFDKDHTTDPGHKIAEVNGKKYRPVYKGVMMGAGGFTPTSAAAAIEAGTYDLIAMGRWFIANPDLPTRLRDGLPLNKYNRNTFYTYGAEGYTDYPTAEQVQHVPALASKHVQVQQKHIGTSLTQAKL